MNARLLKHILQLGIILLLSANTGHAQILNIEKARLDSLDKEKAYRISFETKLNFYNRSASAEDQAKFTSLINELNAIFAPGNHAYIVLGKLSYTENNAVSILNNGYVHMRTNFNYRNKWSYEAFGQIQYDSFRGLSDRYLLGAAIRWRAYKGDKLTLGIGSGPMYEKEIWRNPTEEGYANVNFAKLSSYLIVRWDIAEHVHFNTIFYYQVGYDESIDAARNRLSFNGNFNFKISKFLTFTTSIDMMYEDKPIIPITKFIYGVENGLTLTF